MMITQYLVGPLAQKVSKHVLLCLDSPKSQMNVSVLNKMCWWSLLMLCRHFIFSIFLMLQSWNKFITDTIKNINILTKWML
jgi:hypothetical protein